MRERHWEALSEKIGMELAPTPDLTLNPMLCLRFRVFERNTPITISDRQVQSSSPQVHHVVIGFDLDPDIPVVLKEVSKAGDQPAFRKSMCGRDPHQRLLDVLVEHCKGLAQGIESCLQLGEQVLPGGREGDLAGAALDQLEPEVGFQVPDLVADGGRGDAEFLPCIRKTQPPGDRFESANCV